MQSMGFAHGGGVSARSVPGGVAPADTGATMGDTSDTTGGSGDTGGTTPGGTTGDTTGEPTGDTPTAGIPGIPSAIAGDTTGGIPGATAGGTTTVGNTTGGTTTGTGTTTTTTPPTMPAPDAPNAGETPTTAGGVFPPAPVTPTPPAVDSLSRRRVHVLGSADGTWACAQMIKRLVETSAFRAPPPVETSRDGPGLGHSAGERFGFDDKQSSYGQTVYQQAPASRRNGRAENAGSSSSFDFQYQSPPITTSFCGVTTTFRGTA